MPTRAPVRKMQEAAPAETLIGLNQGINLYTDPTQTNPTQWYSAQNAYSGQFGYIQRARWANIVATGTTNTATIASINSSLAPDVTVTTTAPHGFSPNTIVVMAGTGVGFGHVNPYVGTFIILSTTSTTFTYLCPLNPSVFIYPGPTTLGTAKAATGGAYTPEGTNFTTFKFFGLPTLSNYLLADQNGKLFSFDTGNSYVPTVRYNQNYDLTGVGSGLLNGPWMREVLGNIVYECNGQVNQAGRTANAATIENWGLSAPDVSIQNTVASGSTQTISAISRLNGIVTVTLGGSLTIPGGNGVGMVNIAGVTDVSYNGSFVVTSGSGTSTITYSQTGQNTSSSGGNATFQITKSVGRSYAYAWENANKANISAPSPVSQYFQYANQYGTIQCIEQGTVTTNTGSNAVTGVNTSFTSAWVGRYLWADGVQGVIRSVQSATALTLSNSAISNTSGAPFTVYDPQATHIDLYATADGGATYFLVQRNAFTPLTGATVATAGLQFFDTANAEPPNFPFSTTTSQLYNVPPPVGAFVKEYQGRLLLYGGTIPGQTFFYTNIESTLQGLPQESSAPLNQITLPIQNANIAGMADFPGALIIWSDKQDMFRLTGLLSDNTPLGLGTTNTAAGLGTAITSLPYNLGCANPFAVAITPLGAVWLTTNKELWLYTDVYAPRNIGRPIQPYLSNIPSGQLSQVRVTYYHTNNRNWVSIALPNGSSNNVLIHLDLDLLASNGQPSFFTFDMATNHPAYWPYSMKCTAMEVVYEPGGVVRELIGSTDLIQDPDYQTGLFGTEISVTGGSVTLHPWGNDSAFVLKTPKWLRFNTNRDPSYLASEVSVTIATITRASGLVTVTTNAPHNLMVGNIVIIGSVTDPSYNGTFIVASIISSTQFTYGQTGANSSSTLGDVVTGWTFNVFGVDDDYYTFQNPLALALVPGVNDTLSLGGNPNTSPVGLPFRTSQELFRLGAVNFMMARRILFQVNFPTGTGQAYQLRSIQIGFGPSPPR